MIEQWFLDLDGVRSGPYQTPEVMSLIAEGEVLPHHRISTSLREQRWITILDWRLDQAKISKHVPSSHFSASRSEVSTVEGLQEAPVEKQKVSQVPNAQVPNAQVPNAQVPNAQVPNAQVPNAQVPNAQVPNAQVPNAQVPISNEEVTTPTHTHTPVATIPDANRSSPPLTPIVNTPSQHLEATPPSKKPPLPTPEKKEEDEIPEAIAKKSKRDPMAEMFDMLQNTKQKKEAKQNQTTASGISIEQDLGEAPKKKSGFGLGQTLAIGLGITLVGFALGQLFQQSGPPPLESAATHGAKPTPAAAANTPAPAEAVQIIDRSTDKMTIRGVVKKEDSGVASATPAVKTNTRNSRLGSEVAPQTEKELEELRNLKKELQELKALKNNNNAVDEAPESESEVNTGESGTDPNANPNLAVDPNSISNLDPNATPIPAPADGGGPGNNPNNEQPSGR
jgi:hypothetical protein